MIGKRRDVAPHEMEPGDYGQHKGIWYARTPNGHFGNLNGHEVSEEKGGAITVSPSILIWGGKDGLTQQWHGYLEKGVWREC